MTKKSCRRTMDENKIHEKAVKMRKRQMNSWFIMWKTEWRKPEVKGSTKARL